MGKHLALFQSRTNLFLLQTFGKRYVFVYIRNFRIDQIPSVTSPLNLSSPFIFVCYYIILNIIYIDILNELLIFDTENGIIGREFGVEYTGIGSFFLYF